MIFASRYDFEMNSVDNEHFSMNIPRICRHCNQTGEQTPISSTVLRKTIGDNEYPDMFDTSFVVFTGCSYCGQVTQHYCVEHNIFGKLSYSLGETIPREVIDDIPIPGNVSEISPDFMDIYKQSVAAERSALTHLAGMGYRKSIEFLVTDYLLAYPSEGVTEEWLKNPDTRLSEKISKLTNERLKQLSKAITFLGNDETHYVRRHPEYDIRDLKEFIKVLMSNFENELIINKAEQLLAKPKN